MKHEKSIYRSISVAPLFCTATPVENIVWADATTVSCATTASSVVFRSTQKLRSKDGRKIYLYRSGLCELFDGGRLIVECTYTIRGNEVRLLDENGRIVYSGTFRYASDRINILLLSGKN